MKNIFGKKKRIPAGWPQKRMQNSYRLLLREKRKAPPPNAFPGKAGRLPLNFFWQKYKNNLAGIGIGLILFSILSVVFFFSNLFAIDEIALTRRDLRVNVAGVSTVLNTLRGSNILLLSERRIRELIGPKFPEVKTVELKKNFPRAIEVALETHPIVVKWVMQFAPAEALLPGDEAPPEELILYLNALGQISLADESDETAAFLITEEDASLAGEIYFGMQLIPAEQLQEILTARETLSARSALPITSAQFFRDAREIHFVAENGTAFWLDFFTPLPEQIGKIELALQQTPLFGRDLEYLDLRIPGKLIYKERE